MEESTNYAVEITSDAESYYFELLKYFYKYLSEQSADRKSAELLELAISLEINPQRGTFETKLKVLGKSHRFILYKYTTRKAIKIIYFIDESQKTVFITDFFPCQMDDIKVDRRTK